MKIKLNHDIKNEWKDIINREIDYYIVPINSLDYNCSLEFNKVNNHNEKMNYYECNLRATSSDGRELNTSIRHTDGKQAIRHAMQRLRREVMRNSKLKEFQRRLH